MKENDKIPYTNFEIDESNKKPKITNQQLSQIKQEHDNQYVESLNDLNMATKMIKEGQNNMKNTLKNQEPLLDTINEDLDKVDNKMKMENNKLKYYLEKTSTNCLYWVIGIELFILFLFFLL
jgi:predicted PurR-regulated permease PerM